MMSSATALDKWRVKTSLFLVLVLFLMPLSNFNSSIYSETELLEKQPSLVIDAEPWNPTAQPWGQYGRVPTHNGSMPMHSPDGGPGTGTVAEVSTYGIIDTPTINWVALDDLDGADTYGSIIGDFSASVTSTPASVERCGQGELFAVIISSDTGSSTMSIVTGDDAKIAWEVEIGQTEAIRSTPMLTDVNEDGKPEIILTYDTDSTFEVEVWSPELSCSESGWVKSGHENEKLWSMSDSDYSIGINSPHFATSQSDHKSITQPLIADLDLDGDAELVVALVDRNSNNPTVTALSLGTSTPTDFDWEVVLDRGTHPSDPAWGMLDDDTTAIVLTTIDSNSGNMWIWRIDGATGSLDWERVSVDGTDSDSDAPRLRLPGPVVVQLDSDSAPEMILTIPTDSNGRTPGNGARFVAMEMTSTDEIFEFRTPNGYADAQPLPIDTDDDGIHDRLCWVTWYSESSINFNRKGMAGCHDISEDPPIKEWSKDMQRGSGNDNDEIAVAPPIWMDINDDSVVDIIVPFGKRLWAFDGVDGTSSEVSDGWSSPLSMPHRVWSAPAVADMDNDGTLDILIGDTLVSQHVADFAPLSDNRGISFNPSQPDPGNLVTVTGQFSNIGTLDNQDDLDVAILQNGNEISRQRFTDVEPVAPSGNGGPYTFSVDIVAELGIHTFEIIIDVNSNLSESRKDNNNATIDLLIVEPYAAQIDIPNNIPRINPGTSEIVSLSMLSTGSRTEDWTLTWDDSNLPNGWSITPDTNQNLNPTLVTGIQNDVDFVVSIPQSALGDDNSFVIMTLTLDLDQNITFDTILPLEVLRTRGLTIVGPSGLDNTLGHGRPGDIATAWMMVENVGNAFESTTSIDWTAPSWGGTPTLHDQTGTEIFSLNLAPGEQKELFIHLNTPQNIQLSSVTTSTMTMCIGSGADTLCEELSVNLTASAVTIQPTHQRTLPNQTLDWQVDGTIPNDGKVSWNTASASMIHTDWIWSTDGDLTINGSNIEVTGVADEPFSGNIYLDLPVNAVPQRHYFQTSSPNDLNHNLDFTMQVLQVFRSDATILQPTPDQVDEPVALFVEVTNQILLRLENPGNGEDEFLLSAEVIEHNAMSSSPVVQFTTYNPQRTLGPLATTIATVDVMLSEDTPAQEPFTLRFTWNSLGDETVSTVVDLLIEAEPDHNWEASFSEGLSHQVTPSESINLDYQVINTGNAMDDLVVKPIFEVTYFGQDNSIWQAEEMNFSDIEVNESVSMQLQFATPVDTWAGTTADLTLQLFSDDLLVDNITLTFNVVQVSGWKLNISDTNLIINPDGQNLTLNVEHLGNLARQPWYTKAGDGWNITVPQNGVEVGPYGTSTVTIFVNPPENAGAGEVGVLRLRVSDGDGSGQTIQEVPVRVGTSPSIELHSNGFWAVNQSDNGMPTAWLVNSGNDIAVVQISVSGIPSQWSINHPQSMVISPGQVMGIPISLAPDNNWDKSPVAATIEILHPILGMQTMTVSVEDSSFVFQSTPVISGVSGDTRQISVSDTNISLDSLVTISNQNLVVTLSNNKQNISLINDNSGQEYHIHSAGYQLPQFSAPCSFDSSSLEQLGIATLSTKVASCNLAATQNEIFSGSVILITSMGEYVELDESLFSISANTTESFAVNTSNWKPEAGELTLTLLIVDSYGRQIQSTTKDVVARSNGWNIGISELSANGDIRISIARDSYQRLVGITCLLTVESPGSSWEGETQVIDIGGIDYAPIIKIDDPRVLDKDDLVKAELRCSIPYDIDDNPEDDTAQAFFQPAKTSALEDSDLVFGILTTVAVLSLAYFVGLLNNKNSNKPKPTKQETTRQTTDNQETEKVVEVTEIVNEIDDFSLELEQESDVNAPIDIDEAPPVGPTIEQEDDNTASGRLASIRDEISSDDKPKDTRPLGDRMADFFND